MNESEVACTRPESDRTGPIGRIGLIDQGGSQKHPVVLGFVCDGPWKMPGFPELPELLQFTKRVGAESEPAFGASFYVPVGATEEEIQQRAREKCKSFGGTP